MIEIPADLAETCLAAIELICWPMTGEAVKK